MRSFPGAWFGGERPAGAEVHEHELPTVPPHDVVGFDVAVEHADRVHRRQRATELDADVDRLAGAEALRLGELFERPALHEIHPQTDAAVLVVGAVDAHHVRVPDLGQQPGFVEDRRGTG